jgi:glycosyltransferase involved in cell wall biosynthesis
MRDDPCPCNGVCVIVPQYVIDQRRFADVGFINVRNIKIDSVGENITFTKPFKLAELPEPYNRPDLVVFQETYREEYLQISAELRRNNVPYITVPHGELRVEAQKKKYVKKIAANIAFFNRFIDKALAVQCLSQMEYDNTHFGKKKIIIPNGMDVPDVKKESFCNDKNDGIKFIYIGRLDARQKGLDIMVSAIRLKADMLRENNCHFKIYGPDIKGRAKKLKALIEKAGVSDLLEQNGPVSGAEKKEVLLDGDVFIQTSRYEGMPLGILEAMSFGLPCLVTRGTALGEKVESSRAGWVAETNAESVAQKLEQVIRDKKTFREKGLHGRKVVETEFSREKIAAETVEMYKKLLDG